MDQQPPHLPHQFGSYTQPAATTHPPYASQSTAHPNQSSASSYLPAVPPPHPSLFQNTLPPQLQQPPLSRDRYISERKRRLTSSDSEDHRRPSGPAFYSNPALYARASGHSYYPYTRHVTAPSMQSSPVSTPTESQQGSSRELAIDLTGDHNAAQPSQPTVRPAMQSPSVPSTPQLQEHLTQRITLPRWQPDSEATRCPVCQMQFTFWFRKHHCRRCGRVVCANCTPHRITMPRQYIVQPPPVTDLNGEEIPRVHETTWGGEEVRVCNPCVPDPNLSPPAYSAISPQRPHPQQSPVHHLPWSPAQASYYGGNPPPAQNGSGVWMGPSGRTYSFQSPGHRNTVSGSNLPGPQAQGGMRPPYQGASYQPSGSVPTSHSMGPNYGPYGQPPNAGSPSTPQDLNSFFNSNRPRPLGMPPISASGPPPRPQIAEEDECPVCGEELPPKGADGDLAAREGHVEECIKSHLYSSSAPQPRPTLAGVMAPQSSTPSIPTQASGSRPRRMTSGRMLVYTATEKDCMGEDGLPQECVICLEEFEDGDEMGRLACLCKFHRKCIKDWWETKGQGTCPTHQLHD
ncbi:FYVE-domain-containing protein [Microthyrium microscopicum]|uniref:RING-type E3 ubiquitin transferase n=1 Tax=Microthyrium microscopicum TaxID=703497 RepID=A0A6A6UDW8_9PEZI|nr:FYVE-domain-containing protein [Microthyrium microscopicum]